MRLQLHSPPLLVTVDGRPALLLASRSGRCFVQISRGWGLNHLRWVAAREVERIVEVAPPSARRDQQ